MKRRKWKAETKTLVVLEGLKGRSIAELCNEHQISQAQYYQWREQFLSNATQAFETKQADAKVERLSRENEKLKALVGELTLALKKSDEVLG